MVHAYILLYSYLRDFVGSFFREEIGHPDDVYQLAEEDEEHGDGDAVEARADRTDRHEDAVIEVGEREELQQGHFLRLLALGSVFTHPLRLLHVGGLVVARRRAVLLHLSLASQVGQTKELERSEVRRKKRRKELENNERRWLGIEELDGIIKCKALSKALSCALADVLSICTSHAKPP